jgi:tetratricopeptide (TPR) repeat protein
LLILTNIVPEFARRLASAQLMALGVSLLLIFGCSSDPNRRKQHLLESGLKYSEKHEYQEAIVQFRSAIQIDPTFATAHYQLARAYFAAGNPAAAYREFNQTAGLDPSNLDVKVSLARLLLDIHRNSEAQSMAESVLQANPRYAAAHAILGQLYMVKHDLPNALAELRKAVDLDSGRVEAYAAVGAAYLAMGKGDEAEAAYRKATEVNPGSVQAQVALGQFFFERGKITEAEAALDAACGLDARAVLPRLLLARIYALTKRPKQAEEVYTSLKKVAPDDPQAYQALGLYYVSEGRKENAVSEFKSLAAAKPRDFSVKAYLIGVLVNLNRMEEAAPLIEKALKDDAENPRILVASARMLISQGKYPAAIEPLEKVIKAEPNYPAAYYLLGIAQRGAGLPDLAKASFAQALKLSPKMGSAAGSAASLDLTTGNTGDALQMANQALQANPDSSVGHAVKARLFSDKGDVKHGEPEIQDALKTDPVSLPALATLLKISFSKGNIEEVMTRIAGLLQQHPRNAGLHFLQAVGYLRLKNPDKAEAGVRKALELDVKTPDAYTMLANIEFTRGATEKAKEDLRRAIGAWPRTVSNYVALGTQFERENNWDQAKPLFEKAHALDPTSPYISDELAFIYLEHGGDINVAVSLAQTAKQKLPDSPMTADALGWAYYNLGSIDLAISELKESTAKTPQNPVYQYHLGMAYLGAHRADLAARSLKAALKQDANFPHAAQARTALDQLSQTQKR